MSKKDREKCNQTHARAGERVGKGIPAHHRLLKGGVSFKTKHEQLEARELWSGHTWDNTRSSCWTLAQGSRWADVDRVYTGVLLVPFFSFFFVFLLPLSSVLCCFLSFWSSFLFVVKLSFPLLDFGTGMSRMLGVSEHFLRAWTSGCWLWPAFWLHGDVHEGCLSFFSHGSSSTVLWGSSLLFC